MTVEHASDVDEMFIDGMFVVSMVENGRSRTVANGGDLPDSSVSSF